jgi:pSer/pThr/pTyr-binding forkhead associated (FHA) protein/tetratricopeptide (TPR) repeat protein
MGSVGKLKINVHPLETAELSDGDELQIGPFKLVIFHGEREIAPAEIPAPEPPVEAPPDPELRAAPDPEPSPAAAPQPELAPEGLSPMGAGTGFAPAQATAALPVMDGTGISARAETIVGAKPVVAKLIFTEGPRAGEELFLETFEVTFGRSKKADIFLDDEKLSRIHAKITRVGMGYRLIDLNSRNGTYVNGVRVLEHPLSSFDELQIGNTKIRFLIHDIVAGNLAKGGKVAEQTRSLALVSPPPPDARGMMEEMQGGALEPQFLSEPEPKVFYSRINISPRTKIILAAIGALVLLLVLMPNNKENGTKPEPGKEGTPAATAPVNSKGIEAKATPSIPKEYWDLSPETQRTVERHYNQAQKFAEHDSYEEALQQLKKIQDLLPYYKQSDALRDQYTKKLNEKKLAEAQQKAKADEKQDLNLYLDEGQEYLKEGDWQRAAEAFNSAIVIDPNNPTAAKGLKAAELHISDINSLPPERDPEQDKRKAVADLFQKAVAAFSNKSYQEAIDTADKIRGIELKGETEYLNSAKQIIDRARMLQKEEFEPFLIQAKEKYAEGDFNASRDLCEEMLKRDPAYDEAKECVIKAKKQLNKLAKEAYTHGYILESMNRIEEAKQYWLRAKNFVRSGDEYFDKVNRKLEAYQ